MRVMTKTTAHGRTGIPGPISAWIGRRQRNLSDRLHTAGDQRARQHGWNITTSTGQFGFGARSYRDPRFDRRREPSREAAQAGQRDRPDAGRQEAEAWAGRSWTWRRHSAHRQIPAAPTLNAAKGQGCQPAGQELSEAPHRPAEGEASPGECRSESRTGSRPAKDHITGRSDASDHQNQASDGQIGNQAGE